MPDLIDLSIIIVNWNQPELTAACIRSVMQSDPQGLVAEIILVDNGSMPTKLVPVRSLAQAHPIQLIENSANFGFARANNIGLRVARGRHVLLLNNDTEVTDSALPTMSNYLDQHPDVGAVGARLLNLDGSAQLSFGLFPITPWRMAFERMIDSIWPQNTTTHRGRFKRLLASSNEPIQVDWLLGAALMTRRLIVEKVGLLDERFFMYAEDIDWCYRFKQADWRVVFVPDAPIYHHNGGSAKHQPQLQSKLKLEKQRSLEMFYKKQYGSSAALLLRLVHARQRLVNRSNS